MQAETPDALATTLNAQEPQVSSALLSNKVISFIEYGGLNIYKSTLVSQFNANLFLSKDRLTRMKILIYFNNFDDYIASSSTDTILLGLEMDCGVYFMQQNMTTISSKVKVAMERIKGRSSKILQWTSVLSRVDRGTWCDGVSGECKKLGAR